jgi:hypothetical protein
LEPSLPVPGFLLRRTPPDDEIQAIRFIEAARAKVAESEIAPDAP